MPKKLKEKGWGNCKKRINKNPIQKTDSIPSSLASTSSNVDAAEKNDVSTCSTDVIVSQVHRSVSQMTFNVNDVFTCETQSTVDLQVHRPFSHVTNIVSISCSPGSTSDKKENNAATLISNSLAQKVTKKGKTVMTIEDTFQQPTMVLPVTSITKKVRSKRIRIEDLTTGNINSTDRPSLIASKRSKKEDLSRLNLSSVSPVAGPSNLQRIVELIEDDDDDYSVTPKLPELPVTPRFIRQPLTKRQLKEQQQQQLTERVNNANRAIALSANQMTNVAYEGSSSTTLNVMPVEFTVVDNDVRQGPNLPTNADRLRYLRDRVQIIRSQEDINSSQRRIEANTQRMKEIRNVERFAAERRQREAAAVEARLRQERLENQRQLEEALEALRLDEIRERRAIERDVQKATYLIAETHLNAQRFSLGPMNQLCRHCGARYFVSEKNSLGNFRLCCEFGKVVLDPLLPYPARFRRLFSENGQRQRLFKMSCIKYNNSLSFASIRVSAIPHLGPGYEGFYKIQGQLCHYIRDIDQNRLTRNPCGIFFLDAERAVEERILQNPTLDLEIMRELEDVLRRINPFAQAYVALKDVAALRGHVEVGLQFVHDRNRRYDLPVVNEVAVIFQGDEENAPPAYDLRVYARNGANVRTRSLHFLNVHVDAMCYPLLFPAGGRGYEVNVRHTRGNRNVSIREFYCYRKQIRDVPPFNVYIDCGKLSQKLIVDAWVKVESSRMTFIRQNQNALRASSFETLEDWLNVQADRLDLPLGRVVILPSTYIGSPRNCLQNYQDAMAIVTKFGKPDMFITFTCNPQWPDIRNNLQPGQYFQDRPDLCNRVFKCMLREFIDDITNKHIFGKVTAYIYVIEFQKRGLPHCHLLLALREVDKFIDADDVDRFVSAELPDPERDDVLFEIVSNHMVHGPCGPDKPNAPCLDDEGRCSKNFPKEFCETTRFNDNGYPRYKRSNDGRTIVKSGKRLDNRNVVPYNPFLMKKYNCHINVEICASFKSVKYIFKYVYKGNDRVRVNMHVDERANALNHDETVAYLDQRYVSVNEADWRLNAYEMHEKSHAVIRLHVHLPHRQNVYFRPGDEERALQNVRNTTLSAFFHLNRTDPEARRYLYTEIPYHYVFDERTKEWKIRRRGASKIVVRMYSVSPRDRESFYLRMILLHRAGPRSYEDLRTVNGTVYESFERAAVALNLLENDNEWFRCLDEAKNFQMPVQLRKLFATLLLINCEVHNVPELWNHFRFYLCEDHIRRGRSREEAEASALRRIQRILFAHGRDLEEFGLRRPPSPLTPQLPPEAIPTDDEEDEIFDRFADEIDRIERNVASLNRCQRRIFDSITEAVLRPQNRQYRLFFVDGSGGTGKTWLWNTIISKLKIEGKNVIACAHTGIAATLLRDGTTVHSRFQLPVPTTETSTSRLTPQTAGFLRECDLIVWDEISMSSKHVLHAVNRVLIDVTGDASLFGGKVVALSGDFRQILPVVVRETVGAAFEECVKSSHLWQHFHTITLTENMRADPDEIDFKEWLLRLGEARDRQTYIDLGLPPDVIEVPEECLVPNVVDAIFGQIVDVDDPALPGKVVLCPTNQTCHEINNIVTERLRIIEDDGGIRNPTKRTYHSADSVVAEDDDEAMHVPTEFLHAINAGTIPPHEMTLAIGGIVILLRNLSVVDGLCNGTRLQILQLGDAVIRAKIVSGTKIDDEVFISRMDLTTSEINYPFVLKRRTFPVRPAFALTTNKSQGQTFDRVGIYLPMPVFSHGQLYVAFSRAKRFRDVKVQVSASRGQGRLLRNDRRVFIKNVVYLDAL